MICAKCAQPRERENHSYCRSCAAAYMRLHRRGELPVRALVCIVAECGRPVHGRGLCNLHRLRLARTGNIEARQRLLDPKRYKLVTRPDHPLAHAGTGRVYVHRMVLFDQIGWMPVPCFWCGRRVQWSTVQPMPEDALIADHLDHDRHNNDIANLVPSCNSCNPARTRWRTAAPLMPVYSLTGWDGTDERVGT
jgi:hypothetical protein